MYLSIHNLHVLEARPEIMKIHSMCIVKNESDVIEQVLQAATSWSDYIYVFDNGSTDSTWEKVIALSQDYKQVIPFKKDACRWSSALRGQMFNHYRDNFNQGDWCCRLDADEIYIDNPRLFLGKIPPRYGVACAAMFTYYFTDKDFETYSQDPSAYSDTISVEDKCRYYRTDLSEIRFFRYHQNLSWPDESECFLRSDYKDWPTGLQGDAFPTRIWLKNYRYRSPEQIQKRLDTRRALTDRNLFPQEMQYRWKDLTANIPGSDDFWNWRSRVADSSQLDYDAHDNKYVLREELMMDADRILMGYDIKVGYQNFVRKYVGRPIKRNLVKLGLLPHPIKA